MQRINQSKKISKRLQSHLLNWNNWLKLKSNQTIRVGILAKQTLTSTVIYNVHFYQVTLMKTWAINIV